MGSVKQPTSPDKDKKDILYLKRTPTVTYDSTSGGPIPESIKKFYVQQQLPVRKQSLAASHSQSRAQYYRQKYAQTKDPVPSTVQPNTPLPTISTVKTSMLIEVEAPTPTSPTKRKPSIIDDTIIEHLAIQSSISSEGRNTTITSRQEEEEDDDDFDFRDRPPSSVIIPIDPQDDDDDSDNDDDEFASVFNKEHSMTEKAFQNLVGSWQPSSAHLEERKGSIGDSFSLHSISSNPNKSLESLLLSGDQQNNARLSTDTSFTDLSELTIVPSRSAEKSSAVMTKIQQKREQQQKSIYAYLSQQPSARVFRAHLSRIASELLNAVVLSNKTKEGIEYHDVFTGKELVMECLGLFAGHFGYS
ncbi:hypothetical protein BD560DRAFT_22859 [Blakeslea trispora]|nr:hypothetical protein BD560DRAFT_22859 [Blakeslea trispora]